jgi:para-aminobenzoate synthetase component 1
MHPSQIFPVNNFKVIKDKVLNWSQQFDTFSFLDNHQYQLHPHTQECLVGAGVKRFIQPAADSLEQLQQFINEKKSWYFGHLAYDLVEEVYRDLPVQKAAAVEFDKLFFYEPEIVIRLTDRHIEIIAADATEVFEQITNTSLATDKNEIPVTLQSRLAQAEYLGKIEQLQQHILRGDCYEINFCQEFFADNITISPLSVYRRLSTASPNPFSALYKQGQQWLLCASPERFLKKQGATLLSQPIKGTSKRVPGNSAGDLASKEWLEKSAKDRSENVMIVDLVRNDLARVCEEATVQVDELFGIYSFPQVHQMISTISGKVAEDVDFATIMKAMFPMGSMTGAPKKRVAGLIATYEPVKRGLFSGAVGYIAPDGDFDFNVVIRSILYNQLTRYVSVLAGSGITFYSDPQSEWEECKMKVAAMEEVLAGLRF